MKKSILNILALTILFVYSCGSNYDPNSNTLLSNSQLTEINNLASAKYQLGNLSTIYKYQRNPLLFTEMKGNEEWILENISETVYIRKTTGSESITLSILKSETTDGTTVIQTAVEVVMEKNNTSSPVGISVNNTYPVEFAPDGYRDYLQKSTTSPQRRIIRLKDRTSNISDSNIEVVEDWTTTSLEEKNIIMKESGSDYVIIDVTKHKYTGDSYIQHYYYEPTLDLRSLQNPNEYFIYKK